VSDWIHRFVLVHLAATLPLSISVGVGSCSLFSRILSLVACSTRFRFTKTSYFSASRYALAA
jgi:hypothetical protein